MSTATHPEGRPPLIPVAGVILHQHGRVLLQHRDDKPDIAFPNQWAIFGGHIEPGETPEEAARREIAEELGLRLDGSLDLVYHGDDGVKERFIYATPLGVPLASLTLMEGQGMALLAADEFEARAIVPIHRAILDHFLRTRGGSLQR